jgi:ribosomal protein S18 acetylase RimI-like enzyme
MEAFTRPATSVDSEFCLDLHYKAMGPLIVDIFGVWDPQVQKLFHIKWFDPVHVRIVESAGISIGVLDVRDQRDHIYLSRIELLPEYQGRGIGTDLVRAVLARGQPVRLHVFRANTRARALYERLGFVVESEGDERITMISE